MTDLDSPRRNNDCYFYYYSTCAKGYSCTFRHEPSALGCETMCSFWKEGKCLNVHCNFRHMELRKNRKAIQCYWETQPGGCLKPHCPFMHQNVKQTLSSDADNKIGPNTDTSQAVKPSDVGQSVEKLKNPVDSLVVNFEEESDTESAPSFSPAKKANRRMKVKTLEEIKLEKIQEESAAYFYYHEKDHQVNTSTEAEDDLRHRLLTKMRQKRLQQNEEHFPIRKRKKTEFDENASLDDHIKQLTAKDYNIAKNVEGISLAEHLQNRNHKAVPPSRKEEREISCIKIKTLAEIRAERVMRHQDEIEADSQSSRKNLKKRVFISESDSEVSSTSKDETETRTVKREHIRKKLRLKRLSSTELNTLRYENVTNDDDVCSISRQKEERVISCPGKHQTDESEEKRTIELDLAQRNEDKSYESSTHNSEIDKIIKEPEVVISRKSDSNLSDRLPKKIDEEDLLMDDDDDYCNVTLKAEDELLDEIDNLLGS